MKPRRTPRKKPATPARTRLARSPAPPSGAPLRPEQVVSMRDLFWQNVLREMLTSLSVLFQQVASPGKDPAGPGAPDPSLFDGRLAIITKGGERIAIASIIPLFGCGSNAPSARELALAIECTIFQVRTPDGHVFTVPLQEVRAFHALSPEVMSRLEEVARRRAARREAADDAPPFGFAAFTSLSRGSLLQEPPPAHPTE